MANGDIQAVLPQTGTAHGNWCTSSSTSTFCMVMVTS